MKFIADSISDLQYRYKYILLLFVLIITIFLALGLPNILSNIEPSLEKVLPQEVEEVKLMNQLRTEFPSDMIYIVLRINSDFLTDIRHPNVLKYIDLLEQKLVENPHVYGIFSISKVIKDSMMTTASGVIPDNYEQIKKFFRIYGNFLETDNFISPDKSLTYIEIHSNVGADADIIKKTINDINNDIKSLESYNPGVKTYITGFSAIDKATFSIIISDFIRITFFSFLMILVIVLFTFKRVIKAIIPLSVVMLAVLWTMGTVGYLGITITIVTMVSVAMIMGLGIDFGIHFTHTYFENRKDYNKKDALKITQEELIRSLVGSSLTTSAGFLALLFGVLPAMKNLGIILAIGIIYTLIAAVVVLPNFLLIYDKESKEVNN